MGTSGPVPGTTCKDLRQIVLAYELNFEELADAWQEGTGTKIRGAAVSQRLKGNPPVSVDQLEITLAKLGLDLVEFFLGVETRFHPELELHDVYQPERRNVDRIRARLLARPPGRRHSPSELAEMAAGLETLRFRDAREARRQAIEILRSPDLDPDVAAEAWGVLGVLERYRGRVALAARCLIEALRCRPSPAAKARTMQRVAMLLLFNAGSPGQALKSIFRARNIFRQIEDLSSVGKTYVDEGVVHFMAGDYDAARRAYSTALRNLSKELIVYRVSALQGIAVSAVFLENTSEAFRYLDEASAELPREESYLYLHSGLRWLQGELLLLVGRYAEGADHLIAVWDAYLDLDMGPLEMTLISLRLAKAYLLQDDSSSFRGVLKDLISQETPLRRSHPVLAPTLGELLRQSAKGTVTVDVLEEVYRKLREGTQHAPPLLPVSLPV
jgi:tetratricopeptide (TPR) repeat protein